MYDTLIIGSGPAGLSAAIYAKRAALKAAVIEKNYMGTGQIAESERVDNYPGLYGENGFDLGEKFRNHAKALGAEFIEGEVNEISPGNKGYRVTLSDGEELLTKTIVYAAGTVRRRLGIEGEERLYGKGVSACAVCDGAFYKGKIAAVIGGGDTALGDAVFLSRIAEKVYLIHRRDAFRANKVLQEQVRKAENIELILNAVPTEIMGEKRVEALKVNKGGEEKILPLNGVFVAVGSVPASSLLKGLVKLSPEGYIAAGEDCTTSAAGIFAAGDIRTKPLRQVVTAAADGANSILSVEQYLAELGE